MNSLCGADCEHCSAKENCGGCKATSGKPFGADCIAAEYIKSQGKEEYLKYKQNILKEVNELLEENGIPAAENLFELKGDFVNLSYPLENGEHVQYLDDSKIYLGTQIESDEPGKCYGVVVDTEFILVSSYLENGNNPQLIIKKIRRTYPE